MFLEISKKANVFSLHFHIRPHPVMFQYFSFNISKPTGPLPFANISFLQYLTQLNIPFMLKETSLLFGSMCSHQRIYIYKEYKANSPRLPTGDIYPRKQEAVKKTTSEILSAVLRSLLCGVCVYLTCILCTLYSVHCTVGWVIFALFFKFYAKSCCLLFSQGNYHFLILVQKQVSATPLKVYIFKKIPRGKTQKQIFLEKCFLYCLYYALKNQILHKKIFLKLFYFLKRLLIPKKY